MSIAEWIIKSVICKHFLKQNEWELESVKTDKISTRG